MVQVVRRREEEKRGGRNAPRTGDSRARSAHAVKEEEKREKKKKKKKKRIPCKWCCRGKPEVSYNFEVYHLKRDTMVTVTERH
ncbi:hypothetical protein AGIG_G12926 [Arapaima gigas]